MKRPLAYITAAWLGGDSENAELAAQYCRTVYEAGFSPICPPLYLPLFLRQTPPGWAVWGNEVTPTIPDFGTHCPEVQKGV